MKLFAQSLFTLLLISNFAIAGHQEPPEPSEVDKKGMILKEIMGKVAEGNDQKITRNKRRNKKV